jgi:tetratricopeptide (TPR) repeat protein
VLRHNPQYSRLYEIVGEYAEWEHRYDEIVKMMREAILIDPEDANARAQLGINLIRAGHDERGLRQLTRAFESDPFNVRVYNTLNLYEEVIPKSYVTVEHGIFRLRYHQQQKELLERYVPELLERAWDEMVQHYGFTPETPVGVELYPEREHFSIRTSGLPNTGIQGVCFGRTFASMTPGNETFNLGMTLWHELSHVFHIQLSKSHVPRWFTEGLAEWETLSTQPEWRRELDPDLFEALRTRRLPQIARMNRAFTRAEEMSDMATAYYASTKILVMLEETYGLKKISRMMELWGVGKRTPEVVETVLGVTPERLDARFRDYIGDELSRYDAQFVPIRRTGALDSAEQAAKKQPRDLRAQCVHALALIRNGEAERASKIVERVLDRDDDYPDALWLKARLLMARGKHEAANDILDGLVSDGHDGFEVQMALAELAEERNDLGAAKAAFTAAHRFDPRAAEPLAALAGLARETHERANEIAALRKFVLIAEHSARAYQRLMRLLIDADQAAEAVKVGESAVYVDMDGLLTHRLYAEALAAVGERDRAVFELESALLCPGRPGDKASAHAQLAGVLDGMGRAAAARKHAARAKQLDPTNKLLRELEL